VCDLGNRVAGLVNQVAGKALGQTNKVVRSEVGSWKRYSRQLHVMQSVSRPAVWYVLLQGSYRWSTISGSIDLDRGVCDVGNRVTGLVNQVAGKLQSCAK